MPQREAPTLVSVHLLVVGLLLVLLVLAVLVVEQTQQQHLQVAQAVFPVVAVVVADRQLRLARLLLAVLVARAS
jgi:hypothetical protein